ncbi:bifunctional UDP-3-O-[3-hydroxymyristoyl] N-acetylglucosamine deacetylase/(3R)-hydroxymyristoyl-[acyl-carrier-protein] dehydratase [Candidatus Velamenicoccus archaeovorus]|uniref:Multifunctional fusion protein n=1 Tax=Velamenicoccus archaeovorus TaxID=1930593 RepID=A0A410P2V4_VELA1|nr:bifunctional UDP-3-O-[3-hydroxymyristoyl] N-acetylglucosamine deacetylase/3-hydroxyacyl-ACP dehydratase [Candidatus Velamenicoccus archaeovorus]QAT16354.1 bifunctional UDP-3-O-[3-hydroxymyristoyl] N-acetylglucosamine deacetylase/(3R)-hydroxymyristoyl-[acyl-carrier-protein] dehydratase [Candidatus Velamenicoccus archaeovorus]
MQKTIKEEILLRGKGIHTGEDVELRMRPLGPDMGVIFQRVDLPEKPMARADIQAALAAKKQSRRTAIGCAGAEIQTIEHLMAVFSCLGIDNVLVEINGPEVPGMDGSALKFVEAVKKAGVTEQGAPRRTFKVTAPLFVEGETSAIAVFPSSDFRISYTLSYSHPVLGDRFLDLKIDAGVFEKEIAPARTFCLQEEAQELMKSGMGKGANYENTLVVSKNGVIKNTLRFGDEFIRHKMLDLIGDLALLGMPMKGHVIAIKSGHTMNLRLAQKMKDQLDKQYVAAIKAAECAPREAQVDIGTIMKILPHRYPFLLVDRVISMEEGRRAVGIKNVTVNDYFFEGHFPGRPVMPGVLIVEAMAQVGGVLMLSPAENRGKLAFFMAANNVKFRKPVIPGDQLRIEVVVGKLRSRTGQVATQAFVDGEMVAEAELMFALVEK